jgi:hypothetical protein
VSPMRTACPGVCWSSLNKTIPLTIDSAQVWALPSVDELRITACFGVVYPESSRLSCPEQKEHGKY